MITNNNNIINLLNPNLSFIIYEDNVNIENNLSVENSLSLRLNGVYYINSNFNKKEQRKKIALYGSHKEQMITDLIFLLKNDILKECYIKYPNEKETYYVDQTLDLTPCTVTYNDKNTTNKELLNIQESYLTIEKKYEYEFIKDKNQFEKDMIIECKNTENEWVELSVNDVDKEYNEIYKFLIKNDNIRYNKKRRF